jgi:hypothetical protein
LIFLFVPFPAGRLMGTPSNRRCNKMEVPKPHTLLAELPKLFASAISSPESDFGAFKSTLAPTLASSPPAKSPYRGRVIEGLYRRAGHFRRQPGEVLPRPPRGQPSHDRYRSAQPGREGTPEPEALLAPPPQEHGASEYDGRPRDTALTERKACHGNCLRSCTNSVRTSDRVRT